MIHVTLPSISQHDQWFIPCSSLNAEGNLITIIEEEGVIEIT